ncbi:MAG TPA: acyl-CoA dehydrogenase family protein [Thermoanaerobaculia bacterium]|nr:acyl-CoA dehydrogenase family protein [Thermoanaerobaculia bacterium]
MKDFLSGEHRLMQQTARDFAQRVIAPVAAHHDETGEFPLETVRKLGEMGFMGIEVPEDWGGAGLDALSYAIALIEVCKADASHGTIMSVNNSLFCQGLTQFGTEQQKERFLRPVASGEKIGAFSLTEPMSGSDAGTMKSRAVLSEDGSHYVIDGVKSWVTSAPFADFIVLYTLTQPAKKNRGVTAFLIDTTQPGFARGKTEPKLGIRASATSEIHFEGYRCPIDCRLGDDGQGFKIAMSTLDGGRIGIAAQAVGIAEAALEASVAYAKDREAFGQKIGEFQMIQQKLADMKCRLEASRLLVYNAAMAKMRAKESGSSYSLEASMAKLYASETASWVTSQAIQIHGGMGYSRELPLERYFRDAKITEIYEGTSEIQRLVISRALTGLR